MKKPEYEVISLSGVLSTTGMDPTNTYIQSGKEYCNDQCLPYQGQCYMVCAIFCITECENGTINVEY